MKHQSINQSPRAEAGQRGACLGQTVGRLIGAKDQLAGGAGAGCGQWRGSAAERRFGPSSCQVGFAYCYSFQPSKKFKPDKTHYFFAIFYQKSSLRLYFFTNFVTIFFQNFEFIPEQISIKPMEPFSTVFSILGEHPNPTQHERGSLSFKLNIVKVKYYKRELREQHKDQSTTCSPKRFEATKNIERTTHPG
jgi:hypothetical protein